VWSARFRAALIVAGAEALLGREGRFCVAVKPVAAGSGLSSWNAAVSSVTQGRSWSRWSFAWRAEYASPVGEVQQPVARSLGFGRGELPVEERGARAAGPWVRGSVGRGPWVRGSVGRGSAGPWAVGRGPWAAGPRAAGPRAVGPRVRGSVGRGSAGRGRYALCHNAYCRG
jgi:hypothetical protein